jgi:hypothetical protein
VLDIRADAQHRGATRSGSIGHALARRAIARTMPRVAGRSRHEQAHRVSAAS